MILVAFFAMFAYYLHDNPNQGDNKYWAVFWGILAVAGLLRIIFSKDHDF